MIKFYGCITYLRELLDSHTVIAALVVLAGTLIAVIYWLVTLYQLIALSPNKRNIHKYLIWTIYIPYLNLLWVPWALISANGMVKSVQEQYGNPDSLGTAKGIQILSVPLLILYLFWGTILLLMMHFACDGARSLEMLMYVNVVVVCVLLVFCFYLWNLSAFVCMITTYLKGRS